MRLFEVEPDGDIVWQYINPIRGTGPIPQGVPPSANNVFKTRRYPLDYPGFAGRDLTPGDPLEGFVRPFPIPIDSLIASRASADGTVIDVEWDPFLCPSFDYNPLHGRLQNVPVPTIDGAECGLGIGGAFQWSAVPPDSLFFMIVGTDDTGVYETSWGRDSTGSERFGTKASFRCGTTTKIVSSTCP